MTFDELVDFVDRRMRMSHVYQPVMLSILLRNGGECSEEEIARALLSHDIGQVEYYETITRNMVGRVLRNHQIVSRDRAAKTWKLKVVESLTDEQIDVLVSKCDDKLKEFLASRGDRPWQHRKQSTGYISGTLRYEILKAAKFRCELCGISGDDKALEVDHIIPQSHGGSDDITNLQALCYSCNAMKRDRDDTDFRAVRASYDDRDPNCPFCDVSADRIVEEEELAVAIRDQYPVTDRHMLVVSRRHVSSVFDLGRPEVNACMRLLQKIKADLADEDSSITGFNVGINDGTDAGQTVFHCHWHLIPRRKGDVENPRGGVRNTIPGMRDY